MGYLFFLFFYSFLSFSSVNVQLVKGDQTLELLNEIVPFNDSMQCGDLAYFIDLICGNRKEHNCKAGKSVNLPICRYWQESIKLIGLFKQKNYYLDCHIFPRLCDDSLGELVIDGPDIISFKKYYLPLFAKKYSGSELLAVVLRPPDYEVLLLSNSKQNKLSDIVISDIVWKVDDVDNIMVKRNCCGIFQ